MKKALIKRRGICFIVVSMVCIVFCLALVACSQSGEKTSDVLTSSVGTSSEKAPSVETHAVVGELVSANIPSGWSLVTSTEMTGASGDDFICQGDPYEFGDSYLQVISEGDDISRLKTTLESGSPYGTYYGTVDMENGTWYLADKAAGIQLANGRCLRVLGYEIDFQSNDVQQILGSLKLV